jgi:integrase
VGSGRKNKTVERWIDGERFVVFLVPARSEKVKRRMQKAGIKIGSLHSLRHTNATLLRHKGVPVETVSVRLGHSDVSTAPHIYSHAVAEDDQRAADAWEQVLQDADAWEGVNPPKGPMH